ncbi:hypothetical protein [Phnomibacter ginsenosidimutans]|uniref:Uncharacterized protein n=1 Tax=Phnomibacter ginsenosidimutans TaxID=2676868 RepID=A0A6I6G464_9BACT|nr:hypothetical protein [Phnomibacter ginsenosidimutans]QGW26807.1 hypothetical protein GLV81_00635 [Phnomibacter ginsenosidimutans]
MSKVLLSAAVPARLTTPSALRACGVVRWSGSPSAVVQASARFHCKWLHKYKGDVFELAVGNNQFAGQQSITIVVDCSIFAAQPMGAGMHRVARRDSPQPQARAAAIAEPGAARYRSRAMHCR